MTYRQVFDAERRYTKQDLYEIRFYQEGLWWKAWEWSVYLYNNIFINLLPKNKKILNILKRRTVQNKEGSIIVIGFPIEAFNNFLPPLSNFNVISDREIVFNLRNAESLRGDIEVSSITVDNYENLFLEWKNTLPFTEMEKDREEELSMVRKLKIEARIQNKEIQQIQEKVQVIKNPFLSLNMNLPINDLDNYLINNIIEEIEKYPIEIKTLIDNTNFLIQIKEKIKGIKK